MARRAASASRSATDVKEKSPSRITDAPTPTFWRSSQLMRSSADLASSAKVIIWPRHARAGASFLA